MARDDKVRLGGVVLCGGRSRRMKRSKAWLRVGGVTMLERAVRVLRPVARPIVLARRKGQRLPRVSQPVQVVRDAFEDCGPLAGMLAGLAAMPADVGGAIVIACDYPLMTKAFLRKLVDRFDSDRPVVPVLEGRSHPLCGVYPIGVISTARGLLEARRLRVQDFAAACDARLVEVDALVTRKVAARALLNVNDAKALASLGARREKG